MGETHLSATLGSDVVEARTYADDQVLERAIGKLVLLGKQVGVDADQMISLLESGLSVVDLVEYLASRKGHCRCD